MYYNLEHNKPLKHKWLDVLCSASFSQTQILNALFHYMTAATQGASGFSEGDLELALALSLSDTQSKVSFTKKKSEILIIYFIFLKGG